ncbi:MAG: 50S ribosomal protein L1 [Deltaproteobacteria bacterium]|nr:50S ribosomal protein L1 [Deltaproteobacteria bacterium]MBI2341760.1 50S ribosomal protein L1 [Deltaproteobacteria bacterium]MBI2975239.1 50S ribosomal protein L1 [Deltaproteobacteria bacterium]
MFAKKYKKSSGLVDKQKKYSIEEAFAVLDKMEKAKFDETVDVAIRLGVDPKQSDQMVRGAIPLPHGLGKTLRVIVFAKGDKEKEARDAGANEVGADDLVEKIKNGWMDFDKAIATPDLMGVVSKIGKILGPRGLMPNPKLGTVTFDVAKAVKEAKAGRVEFRVEKSGIIHAPIGKRSFGAAKLKDNFNVLLEAVIKAKPSSAKGTYLRSMAVSSTMSPGVRMNVSAIKV